MLPHTPTRSVRELIQGRDAGAADRVAAGRQRRRLLAVGVPEGWFVSRLWPSIVLPVIDTSTHGERERQRDRNQILNEEAGHPLASGQAAQGDGRTALSIETVSWLSGI